jgi:hypothetical protein
MTLETRNIILFWLIIIGAILLSTWTPALIMVIGLPLLTILERKKQNHE